MFFYQILADLSDMNLVKMKFTLPPNSLCSNGGKIFIVHNFQKKRIMEFSRKGNKARKTENTTRVSGIVTSSNFSRKDGTIRILTHFLAKNHSKLTIEDKNLIH